jgi:hypothetical protein
MARLDAREIVTGTDGEPMLFHRGGWGFEGDDQASAVHYGHVRLSDLESSGARYERAVEGGKGQWRAAPIAPWAGPSQAAGNGAECSAWKESTPRSVAVQRIPGDVRYLNSAQTNAVPYAIYGDPSEDLGPAADRARGIKYTMLTWSWINVRGGGVARSLVRDGERFRECTDVPPIRLSSVADAASRRITGWVEARYGAIGSEKEPLFGWLVVRHRHGDEPVVEHLR